MEDKIDLVLLSELEGVNPRRVHIEACFSDKIWKIKELYARITGIKVPIVFIRFSNNHRELGNFMTLREAGLFAYDSILVNFYPDLDQYFDWIRD